MLQPSVSCASRTDPSAVPRCDQEPRLIICKGDGRIGDDGAAVAVRAGKEVRRAGNVIAQQRNAGDKCPAVPKEHDAIAGKSHDDSIHRSRLALLLFGSRSLKSR